MKPIKQLNNNGQNLRNQLSVAKQARSSTKKDHVVNVAGVGKLVSTAYEQLRNAAEYTQDHLLRQRAIRRFYVRNLSLYAKKMPDTSLAEELVVELTQAGYLENDSLPLGIITELQGLIDKHYNNLWRLQSFGVRPEEAQQWTLDLVSVTSEKLIVKDPLQPVYAQFAFYHYQATLQKEMFIEASDQGASYEACLYVAVHRALLKSDIANVRFDMQQLYQVADSDETYAAFHANIDTIFQADITDRITRHINKYGAPLRVFKGMIEDNPRLDELLLDSRRFHTAYKEQIEKEYTAAKRKVNKGIVKSIIFLFITKTLVGLAIEIPYDIWLTGAIVVVPLIINLLAPVIYMAILRLGLKMPGKANTEALAAYAENMLFEDASQANMLYTSRKKPNGSMTSSVAYVFMFVVVFGIVINQLSIWEFNFVQGAIFFLFLATASFLGFRLSRIVRELELVVVKAGFVATIRDFLYLPFIKLGQWLSEKYEKINVVALILDTLIEVPLKTVLRLLRQWARFISEKKDEI